MTRYEQLAQDIKSQIENGVWRAGDKLPSVRATCRTSGLSIATVMQSYQLLESQGWVTARPQSGYYVAPKPPEPSLPSTRESLSQTDTVNINDVLFDVLQQTRKNDAIPLSSAFPDPELFPFKVLTRCMASSGRKMAPKSTVNNLPPGNDSLRRCIAQRYNLEGIHVLPDDIVVTSGAMEALNLSLQVVTNPGDLVAVESPTFYGALQAIERLKLKVVEIPSCPKSGIDLEMLDQALSTLPIKACWFMTNFQNPLGHTVPKEKKQKLVKLLCSHDVPLIEDDVYSELYFDDTKPQPAKAFDSQHSVLHCGSFSKCLAPGYRVGWVVNRQYAKQLQRAQLMSTLSASMPTQLGIADYLQSGGYDTHLRKLRKTLKQRQQDFLKGLRAYLPEEVKVTSPKGGYFVWVEMPECVNAESVYTQLLEDNIGIAPGILFSSDKHYAHHIRLNCSFEWDAQIEHAIRQLGTRISEAIYN
ncbi:putative Bacterial regulatory protein GntR [Vibrio nigripulchritudo SOn1]|uniref:Bacterial regulatory protein GntR n=1 Tax=Vibrio nigripulchritudo SOn1 TaxID=1238450 RepID=A0AAV2W0S2_9VIBR|nr:PLP-dependent aminotransferase family protein [Vibrio nigripulchritudo]CCO50139.1 putative Bacterial regulatory protein GntR [Vibrio nigripulchritudo SOn1]